MGSSLEGAGATLSLWENSVLGVGVADSMLETSTGMELGTSVGKSKEATTGEAERAEI